MIDLLTKDIIQDPYPTYNFIREKYPVCQIQPKAWLISRSNDVRRELRNYHTFTATRKTELFSPCWLDEPCQSDLYLTPFEPPEYTSLRLIINPPFTKKSVNKLREYINQAAAVSIKQILKYDKFNVLRDLSYPFIGNIMAKITGLNQLQDTEEIFEWIHALELATTPDLKLSDKQAIKSIIIKQKILFKTLIEDLKKSDHKAHISFLLNNNLSTNELINAIELIIRAGFQTTIHTIASAVLHLISNRSLLNTLIATPELVPNYVDEFLRLYSSVPLVARHATKDIILHNIKIPAGHEVYFSLAAANRDPRVFNTPNSVNLSGNTAKEHIAFGYGPHVCMGLHLARLELEVLLAHLIPVMNTFTLPDNQEIQWIKTLLFRGVNDYSILNHQ